MSDVVNNFNFEFLSNFDDLDDLSLSQAVDKYELAEISSGEFDDIDFGQFGMSTEDLISGSLENKRFGSVKQVDTADIRQLVANQESKNTRRNTNWAKRTWDEWAAWRGNIPDLTKMNVSDLNHFLSCFVLECRRKDGSEYPAATLYQISAGLLRYMRDNGVTDLNFLDNNDKRFYNFRKTLDARMKEISSKGIGLKKKQADPISPDDENLLWDKNLLGSGSSKSMLNTVFYYNCKLFGLRGMDEHRSLTSDQFTLGQDKEGTYIDFQGKTSKNFSGGLHQRKIEAKHVRHYSSSSDMRSLYLIYKNYLDLIGSSGPGSFYRYVIIIFVSCTTLFFLLSLIPCNAIIFKHSPITCYYLYKFLYIYL